MTRFAQQEPDWADSQAWKMLPITEKHTGKQVGESPSAASSSEVHP